MEIRLAGSLDLEEIFGVYESVNSTQRKMDYFSKSISSKQCLVAEREGSIIGFLIFNYDFFEQGFVSLVVTQKDFSRKAVATKLFEKFEEICKTTKLFTSTNESNLKARNLFKKMGFVESGKIENLDEGDPEIFYFKKLDEKNVDR